MPLPYVSIAGFFFVQLTRVPILPGLYYIPDVSDFRFCLS